MNDIMCIVKKSDDVLDRYLAQHLMPDTPSVVSVPLSTSTSTTKAAPLTAGTGNK